MINAYNRNFFANQMFQLPPQGASFPNAGGFPNAVGFKAGGLPNAVGFPNAGGPLPLGNMNPSFRNVNPFGNFFAGANQGAANSTGINQGSGMPMGITKSQPDIATLLTLLNAKDTAKPATANEVVGKPDGKPAALSGKGSIDGTRFRSGDGENYSLNLVAGNSYNLLSDGNVALNGNYKTVGSNVVLGSVALSVAGDVVTFSDDGTLRINGQAFSRRTNNLDGAVVKDGNSWVIKADGYEFKLRNSGSGVKVDIVAQSSSGADGLWGASFDGTKLKESELKADIRAQDYRVADLVTFPEGKSTKGKSLDDEERTNLLWNSINPVQTRNFNMRLGIDSKLGVDFRSHGAGAKEDDLDWSTKNLRAGVVYNIFSDEGIQVNGKFNSSQNLTELGLIVDGEKITAKLDGSSIRFFDQDGTRVTTGFGPFKINGNKLTVKGTTEEAWNIEIDRANTGLMFFFIQSETLGANAVRSTGILGDSIGAHLNDDNGNDLDGAGYIRGDDGRLTRAGQRMTDALAAFELGDLLDTEGGRIVYR